MAQVRDELVAMVDRALGEDPKAALVAARQLREETEWLLERAVALARRESFDWGRIGRNLGMSRQGARQKFPLAPPRQPPHLARKDAELRAIRETERLVERLVERRCSGAPRPEDDDDPVFW